MLRPRHARLRAVHDRTARATRQSYSEAQFKTLKYRPGFPARFGSIEAARAHCQEFFGWHDNDHHLGGLGLHTAADIHHGHAPAVQAGERADSREFVEPVSGFEPLTVRLQGQSR